MSIPPRYLWIPSSLRWRSVWLSESGIALARRSFAILQCLTPLVVCNCQGYQLLGGSEMATTTPAQTVANYYATTYGAEFAELALTSTHDYFDL